MIIKVFIFLVSSSLAGGQIAELKCWTQRNQTHYAGLGLGQSTDINDRIQCINKCRELEFCGAVDMDDATTPKCWYQMNKDFVASVKDLAPLSTCTNYLYDFQCGKLVEGVDLSCWHVTPRYHIPDLELLADVKSLAKCLKACIDKEGCNVVDWDVRENRNCWIQTKPMEVSVSKLQPQEFVTDFILSRDCLKQVAGIDLTYWRVSYMTRYSSTGLVQVDKTDLKSCLEFCLNDKNCNMVDFDPSQKPPCFAQTKSFDILRGSLVQSKTCSNYYLLRSDYLESLEDVSVELATNWFYLVETEYSGKGLTLIRSAKSMVRCLKKCKKDASCTGFTFTPSSDVPCVHIKEQIECGLYKNKKGVNLYVLNKSARS